jgi:hypothetical protein
MPVRLYWPHDASASSDAAANAPSAANVARVRAAFDDEFLYLAVEVPAAEPLKRERTVEPTGTAGGNPWGPEAIQFALGTADGDEVEHVLSLVPTAAEPVVVRLHRPGMALRNPLPGLPIEGWGEVPGSRVAITWRSGRAYYEAAISRKALTGLPWGAGRTWRFGFLIDGPGDMLPGGVSWREGQLVRYQPPMWHAAQWGEIPGDTGPQPSRTTFFPIGRPTAEVRSELGLVRSAGEAR